MRQLLLIIAIALCSCVSATLPSGAKVTSIGGRVAYHKTPSGAETLITDHDAALAAISDLIGTVADTVTTGGVTKFLGKEREVTARAKDANAASIINKKTDADLAKSLDQSKVTPVAAGDSVVTQGSILTAPK